LVVGLLAVVTLRLGVTVAMLPFGVERPGAVALLAVVSAG
jgi:hypothetical protein